MNHLFHLQASQLKSFYNSLSLYRSKDKLDMVLEPLQSMIQLALLSVTPIGTKLTIQENILYLQVPGVTQPINRWYHSDKKDDLIFLFQVIKRFIKWYNPKKDHCVSNNVDTADSSGSTVSINNSNNNNIKDKKSLNKKQIDTDPNPNTFSKKSPIGLELYQLIVKMSIKGLNNLIKTYNSTDNITIIQVINMYKTLLENNDLNLNDIDKTANEKINIDEVFENIVELYEPNIINLIYSSLLLIEKEEDPVFVDNFIEGLNMIMSKNNKQIQNWIKVNLNV